MKRFLLAALAALCLLPGAFAQNAPNAETVKSWASQVKNASASAASTVLSGFPVTINDPQTAYWSFSSAGTSINIAGEVSLDNGATWIMLPVSKPTSLSAGTSTTWTADTTSIYQADLSPGIMFRLRTTSYGSGTATANVTFRPWVAPQHAFVTPQNSAGLIVQGNVASAAADSGNPVKIGGVYNSTLPTLTDGQRGNVQIGTRGAVHVELYAPDSASGITAGNTATDGVAADATNRHLSQRVQPMMFNSSTWDREFTCPNSAVINVALGTTTQLVALQSSQIIRVCSFVISGDTAATTATFVYGTGANCGTGTTSITGAMRMQDEGNISSTGMNGSLFRTIASNALCLTAATGAVTGFVTYAQY